MGRGYDDSLIYFHHMNDVRSTNASRQRQSDAWALRTLTRMWRGRSTGCSGSLGPLRTTRTPRMRSSALARTRRTLYPPRQSTCGGGTLGRRVPRVA
jgi:hypothetical protein